MGMTTKSDTNAQPSQNQSDSTSTTGGSQHHTSLNAQLLHRHDSISRGAGEYGTETETESTATATTQETANPPRIASPFVSVAHDSSSLDNRKQNPLGTKIRSDRTGPADPQPVSALHAPFASLTTRAEGYSEEAYSEQTCTWTQSNIYSNPIPSPRSTAGSGGNFSLKILVSNNIAGSIIGKSGESILKIQNQSKCRIKLSQSSECFPGTSDRVCLLQGDDSDSVKGAARLILDKFREVREGTSASLYSMSESQHSIIGGVSMTSQIPITARAGGSRSTFVVRVLVPSLACGMLIGRGGSNIKAIADETNAKIQLAQKEDTASVATSERIVTITGSLSSCVSCTCKVIDDMATHPDVSQYSNMTTSYSRTTTSPSRPTHSVGSLSPVAQVEHSPMRQTVIGSPLQPTLVGWGEVLPTPTLTASSHARRLPLPVPHVHHGHDDPRFGFSLSPSGPPATTAARDTFLAPAYDASQQNLVRPSPQGNTVMIVSSRSYAASSGGRPSFDLDQYQQDLTRRAGAPVPTSLIPDQGAGVQSLLSPPSPRTSLMTTDDRIQSIQVAVPDALVGIVLGRGGSYLNELQTRSGARIEVSQRGEFVLGTTNRVVTITGNAQSCATAHFLINRKLTQHHPQSGGASSSQQRADEQQHHTRRHASDRRR